MQTIRKLSIITLLLPVACLYSPELYAQGKIQLGLHLQKGKTYNIRMTTDQKMTTAVSGQEMVMLQKIAIGYTFAVEDLAGDGTASIRATYATIQVHLEGPMGTTDYDSDNPTAVESPMGKVLAALAGQSFSLKLTAAGKVEAVSGMEALMDQILAGIELPDGPMREGLINNLKSQYSDRAATELIGQMFAVYPEAAVGVGDSWSKNTSTTKGLPMSQQHTWTLKSLDKGVAVIQARTVVATNPQAPPLDFGAMKLGLQISGLQEGTLSLDQASGWIVGAEIVQKLSGEYKFEGGTDVPAGMSMPLTVEAIVRLEPF